MSLWKLICHQSINLVLFFYIFLLTDEKLDRIDFKRILSLLQLNFTIVLSNRVYNTYQLHSWNPHLVQVSYNCWWPLSRRWLLTSQAVCLLWYTHSLSRSKPRRPSGPWRLRTRVHCTDRSGNLPPLEGLCKNCCPLWTPGWYPAEISIKRWIIFRFQRIAIFT